MLTNAVADTGACLIRTDPFCSFRDDMKCNFLECSGGNKRKLSTAVALVGNPPIVLLVGLCTILHATYAYNSKVFR